MSTEINDKEGIGMRKALWIVCIATLIFSMVLIFMKWRITGQKNYCLENIQILEEAKGAFGATYGAGMGSEITFKVLKTYIKDKERKLECPNDGKYDIHPVGDPVTCTVHLYKVK